MSQFVKIQCHLSNGVLLSTHFIASLSCVDIENTSGFTKILAKRVRKGNTLMLLYLLFAVLWLEYEKGSKESEAERP